MVRPGLPTLLDGFSLTILCDLLTGRLASSPLTPGRWHMNIDIIQIARSFFVLRREILGPRNGACR